MAEAPGAVQRQAWVDGVLPPVEQVRPGLWSIPVPIPDNPLRYVLVYAFELPDGVASSTPAGTPRKRGRPSSRDCPRPDATSPTSLRC